jgi:predicted ribosome quality control (RQC) complex YloA/Tae2 family protein
MVKQSNIKRNESPNTQINKSHRQKSQNNQRRSFVSTPGKNMMGGKNKNV